MEKLITIVIPTYNMEKYLDKCLTSLIVPDEYMELLEVLVVNDGSKDNSSAIAHRYEDKYPQTFRVIDKEKGNYGSCVNRGVKEAAGKYIKILDGDDTFDNENWLKFIQKLSETDADLVLCDYTIVDEDGHQVEYRQFDITPNSVQVCSDVLLPLTEIEMHAIAYRRNLLLEMDYLQTEGISYTDTEWATIPIMNVQTVYYAPLKVYHYLVGRNGQTIDPKIYIRRRHEIFRINNRFIDICKEKHLLQGDKGLFYKRRLLNFYRRMYAQSLIYQQFPVKDVVDIDKNLREKSPEIYEGLNLLTFSNIRYVDLWRKNGYVMPLLQSIMIRVICIKQKYFPWLSVGRINSNGNG